MRSRGELSYILQDCHSVSIGNFSRDIRNEFFWQHENSKEGEKMDWNLFVRRYFDLLRRSKAFSFYYYKNVEAAVMVKDASGLQRQKAPDTFQISIKKKNQVCEAEFELN